MTQASDFQSLTEHGWQVCGYAAPENACDTAGHVHDAVRERDATLAEHGHWTEGPNLEVIPIPFGLWRFPDGSRLLIADDGLSLVPWVERP